MNQYQLQNRPEPQNSELIPLTKRRVAVRTDELSPSETVEPLEDRRNMRQPTPPRHTDVFDPQSAPPNHADTFDTQPTPPCHANTFDAQPTSPHHSYTFDTQPTPPNHVDTFDVQPTPPHHADTLNTQSVTPPNIPPIGAVAARSTNSRCVTDGFSDCREYSSILFEGDAAGFLIPIPASSIVPNRFQPRKRFDALTLERLAASIRQYGILQPITVRKLPDAQPPKYEIVCGERRYRAGLMAGIEVFRCHLLQENDLRVAELSVIENLLRDDLNIFEQAEAFHLLITTFGLTQQQVAERIGLSQSAVANKLRLLKLGAAERQGILENGLTERHARCLLRLNEPKIRLKFIELITKDQLNVSSTEQLVEKYIKYTASTRDAAQNTPPKPHHRTTVGVLHDVRLFSNSIEKAADILRNSGIAVETQCREESGTFLYTIRISKQPSGV